MLSQITQFIKYLIFEGVYFSKIERYDQLTLINPSGPKSHKSTTHQKYSEGYLGLIHLKKMGGRGGEVRTNFRIISPPLPLINLCATLLLTHCNNTANFMNYCIYIIFFRYSWRSSSWCSLVKCFSLL